MHNPTVTLTRCSSYDSSQLAEAIARQFELLGGLDKYIKSGDRVLLKPNLIAPKSRRAAAQTDPAVILETARLLKDFGAKPFVADSPAWSTVQNCVQKLKLEKPLKELGVAVKQLDKPRKCQIGKHNITVGISSVALEADVIINLPKFKAHKQLVATFAVKNMFGCVTGKKKAVWHFTKGKNHHDFCEMLIEIFRFLNPALTIIDAVIAMDGDGPISGRPRPLGLLIGGTDPIACETICCKLAGIDPDDLPILKTAKQMRLPCPKYEKINITGDGLPDKISPPFILPELIPLRFSLLHLCKSLAKQAFLLTKSAISKILS